MKNFVTLIVISALFCFSQNTKANSKYQKLDSNNDVTFYYKWKPSKFLKKESPKVLLLKIENNNDYAVQANFVVDYFWEAIRKASSPAQSYCIKSGKKIKGRLDDLGFNSASFSNEDMKSEKFIMELSGIEITKTKDCIK